MMIKKQAALALLVIANSLLPLRLNASARLPQTSKILATRCSPSSVAALSALKLSSALVYSHDLLPRRQKKFVTSPPHYSWGLSEEALDGFLSKKSLSEVVAGAQRSHGPFQLIITGDESEEGIYQLAQLAAEQAIPCAFSRSQAQWASNKLAMKERLLEVFPDTQTADFVGLNSWPLSDEITAKIASFGFPLVVKPTSKCGGEGVSIIHSQSELDHKFAAIKRMLGKNPHIVEEYIKGKTMRIDAVVAKGEVIAVYPAYYEENCLSFYIDGVSTITSSDNSEAHQQRYRELIERIVTAFAIENGVIHAEAIESNDDTLYFLETALRPGGDSEDKIYTYGANMQQIFYQGQLGIAADCSTIKTPSADKEWARIDLVAPRQKKGECSCLTRLWTPNLELLATPLTEFNCLFMPKAQVIPREADTLGSLLFYGPKEQVAEEAHFVLRGINGHVQTFLAPEQRSKNWPLTKK